MIIYESGRSSAVWIQRYTKKLLSESGIFRNYRKGIQDELKPDVCIVYRRCRRYTYLEI